MGRVLATFGGAMALALVAGGLTEATMAWGHHGRLTNDGSLRPAATATPVPTASATPAPTATPKASPTPVVTPKPSGPVGVTNSFVHMRSGKSTATPILVDLDAGTTVEILSDSDSQWQQVRYNGRVGYLFKLYLNY